MSEQGKPVEREMTMQEAEAAIREVARKYEATLSAEQRADVRKRVGLTHDPRVQVPVQQRGAKPL